MDAHSDLERTWNLLAIPSAIDMLALEINPSNVLKAAESKLN